MSTPDDEKRQDLTLLVGLSLGKAFDVFVVNSEQVQKAIAEARITNSDFLVRSNAVALIFKDGYWPLNVMKDKKAQRLMTQKQIVSDRRVRQSTWMAEFPRYLELNTGPGKVSGQRNIDIPESVRVAYRTIFERFTQFVDLLFSSDLIVEGRHKFSGERTAISQVERKSEFELGLIGLLDNSFGRRGAEGAMFEALELKIFAKPDGKNSTQKRASDSAIDGFLREEFAKPYRPKREIISDVAAKSGASNRRVLRHWDNVAPKERTGPGRRKKQV